MCIRDRNIRRSMVNDDKIKYIDGKLKGISFSTNRLVELWDRLQAVSYTHLDVYKRQV